MDDTNTHPTPSRRGRLARWGALAGGLAVVGGVTAGSTTAVAADTATVAGASVLAPAVDLAPAAAPQVAAQPGPPAPVEEVRGEFTQMPAGYTAAQYDAFFGAGYTTGEAQELAALWQTDEVGAKSRAGQMLLDGQVLPVTIGSVPFEDAGVDPLWAAFSGAGYTYDDAVALADLWQTDVTTAKARTGQAVLDGTELPIAPTGAPAESTQLDPLWAAFFEAGYTYDDAVALADLWEVDVVSAKARTGQAVLDGVAVPIAPGTAPAAD